jgi:hydroxyacylglutathione hydrolase
MEIVTLQVPPIGTNCYLVCDKEEALCAIVDPGGDPERIAAQVAALRCAPACILLTHGHYDHVGGVAELQKKYPGIPVYLNERDCYPASNLRARQIFPPLGGNLRSYDEGDTVEVGSLTFTVLATPGHTEGGVTLRVEDTLLCGDTLFAGSCGRTDFVGGSGEKMRASLKRLGDIPENLKVLPGHMGASDLDSERAVNNYLIDAMEGTL